MPSRRVADGASRMVERYRWSPLIETKVRSDEWKRRALRNHFPEVWLKHCDWAPSLETYRVDPEFHWGYYQQAHRQMLYNHPDDYTSFIEEVLDRVETHPEIWVPRCLRVFEDMKDRYGAAARQRNVLIQVFGRARLLQKAEEAFAEIGALKLPYTKDNMLAMARAYILCREEIGEEKAVAECKRLFDDAMAKQMFLPPSISSITFGVFYESLKRLGSEADRMERKAQHEQGLGPGQRAAWSARDIWHNVKPYPRLPREWLVQGHPLDRAPGFGVDFKGVKAGDAFYNQDWIKYGYPSQIRFIEKWGEWRKKGGWKPWSHHDFVAAQWPEPSIAKPSAS